MDNNTIEYVGERLWLGQLGHFSLVLAFVSGLVAFIAYSKSTNSHADALQERSWRNMGRIAFGIQSLGILSAIGLIFYMMLAGYYEYEYAFNHVSDELPLQYIFSAFWEGQEGSFLLWMFWHVVLGGILIGTARSWEMPVMAVFSLVQVFLVSMILGIYITEADGRLGSSPFALLRDNNLAPIFNDENYLSKIKGDGLNPLLQNYWMTIHPPTLFLGFASTLIPFAFAIAGWWRRQYREWLTPMLPWALFSAAILGLGIAMGGAWAYEALSFGGYWAWDPVENASFVPWLILLAGIHTAVVARNTEYSVKSSFWFLCLSFILVVYSTFLTRSGILGETSVHSFTEMGLEWHLVIFLIVITVLPMFFAVLRRREIASPEKEESAYSREFWMFVGSLVLLLSSALISFTTSIPVFNKVLGTNIAPPNDVVAHHNAYQIWPAMAVAVLSGVAQFMRYKMPLQQGFLKQMMLAIGVSFAISLPATLLTGIHTFSYMLLVWAGLFAVIANLQYVWVVLRGQIRVSGSAVAHIGFGLLLVGIVFSGVLKDAISESFGSDQLTGVLDGLNKQTNKNVMLTMGTPIPIKNGYTVTYKGKREEGNAQYYALEFVQRDAQGQVLQSFETEPNALFEKLPNGNFKLLASNPNTKRYLSRDIFTLAVPSWAFEDPNQSKTESKDWESHKIEIGDTIYTSQHYIIFEGVDKELPQHPDYQYQEGDIPVTAILSVRMVNSDTFWQAKPIYYIRGNREFDIPVELPEIGLSFRLPKILAEERKMQLDVLDANEKEYVIVQALVFPGINLVWLGCILMTVGLLMAAWQRKKAG